jgi:hypothetical protein
MLRLIRLPIALLFPALLSLALSACAVSLISQYDEQTDSQTTDLQRAMSAYFETLRSATAPACTHPNFADFYRDRRVDVSVLDLRVRSIPKNTETIGQVEGIGRSLTELEGMHQDKGERCLSAEELSPVERAFQQQFLAILTLEQAKKRGED